MRRNEAEFVTSAGRDAAKALGDAVRTARLAMNSTQADFCARARISRATLARIEAGAPAVSFAAWLSALEEASLLHLLSGPKKPDAGPSGVTRERASGRHGAAARADDYDF